ncbi:MAG: HlyD family efflux transporter periplasmic adaptor subunit [Christensenellales bacterium]|nr:HlyD family efflux transporter periplasmic adaptor subunit [Christensenellales bacterium]
MEIKDSGRPAVEAAQQQGKQRPQKPQKPKKPRKPWTVKRILVWVAVGVVGIFIAYSCVAAPIMAANALKGQVSASLGVTTLQEKDIQNTIGGTGTVESGQKHYVYPTTSGYSVMEIPVEVGDTVQAGDVLCILDDSALASQRESSELSLDQNVRAADQQVKTVRDSYEAAVAAVKDGTNSTLISAQSQVTNAYYSYLSAVDQYNQYQDSLNRASAALSTAKQSLEAANEKVTAIQQAIQEEEQAAAGTDPTDPGTDVTTPGTDTSGASGADTSTTPGADTSAASGAEAQSTQAAMASGSAPAASAQSNSGGYRDRTLEELQAALPAAKAEQAAAQTAVNEAQAAYNSASGQGYSLSLAVDSAYNGYVTALKSLDAAIASVETQLQSSENQLDSAKLSAQSARETRELTLEQMDESMEDLVITAPAAGTVTAVYATVGGPSTGLLFVIEDVEDLVVKTTIRSYDVGQVQEGMDVTIKSDATGDASFAGTVSFIAPASQKTATGETNTANEVFDAEVKVLSQDTGLRIGMSVRLNYVLEAETGVLAVPYDAVYTNASGQSCVMAARDQGNGKYLLEEIPVATGVESDVEVAISGPGIQAGLQVLNDPAGRQAGEVVTLVQ